MIFGAGYVGGAVAKTALKSEAKVTVLNRNEAKAAALGELGCQSVSADLANNDWHEEIPPAEYILNAVSSGGGGVSGYRRSYTGGMLSIASWARKIKRCGHLIYTGSTSVYPQGGGDVVDETSSALATEERTEELMRTESLVRDWPGRSSILRLAGIYGPGRHYLLDQLRAGATEFAGLGDHRLNLIHLDDIVSAIFRIWALPLRQEYELFNVSDGHPALKSEVVNWLADQLELPRPKFSGKITLGRRGIRPNRRILNTKLRQEAGWNPVYSNYREGYRAILGA
ncbi:MAG: SDR family oxidoreductase [Synoicihabitans sp.]